MSYIIQPRFRSVYLVDNVRLIFRREVEFEKYIMLTKAKEEAKRMVADDGAMSATVYELGKKGAKTFKLRWEWRGDKVIMVSGA